MGKVHRHALESSWQSGTTGSITGVLEQYDKPDFPPSLWKTILLELKKLHGESFTLEATKSDNYSIGEGIELEVKDNGGGAKSKTIGDFSTWSILCVSVRLNWNASLRL